LKAINLSKNFEKLSDYWSPKIIAEMNDYQFKLVRARGKFIWHTHEDTDETFIVLDGKLTIEFRDRLITLKKVKWLSSLWGLNTGLWHKMNVRF